MDATIQTAVNAWLDDPAIAEADKQEIRQLVEAGNERELTDRFYQDLAFGTGGMRGLMGAGRNRMNVYTVGAAAQGLANYVAEQGEDARTIYTVNQSSEMAMPDPRRYTPRLMRPPPGRSLPCR